MRSGWLGVLALAACNRGGPAWQPVAEGLDAALLSVGGTGPEDVWAVGADAGDGPLVVRWDGVAWQRLATGTRGDLWWLWADADAVWMVGEGGRVLQHDRASGDTSETSLEAGVTLFGLWGAAADGLRTVGGDLNVGPNGARAYRREGGEWVADALPASAAAQSATFKVWGRGPSDVWAVGAGGTVLRDEGEGWAAVTSPTTAGLLTVHGDEGHVYAVGGYGNGVVLRLEDGAAVDESPAMAPAFNGVFALGGGEAVAVGRSGAAWSREDGVWTPDPEPIPTVWDLHAVWGDGAGGQWTVGGSLASRPLDEGVIYYRGPGEIAAYTP